MERGKRYQVYCYIDDKTYRIVCSSKIEKFQKAISEKKHASTSCRDGRQGYGQSRRDRYDDRYGYDDRTSPADRSVIIGDFSSRLFEHIKLTPNGFSPYHDKSPAEEIYSMFGVSKKVFKQAVGDLYKRDLIKIRPDGIELTVKGKAMGAEE
ncbi:MAG: hypothetical protein J1F40_04350 [Prevotellaceae bacterium]|nr:hypothetical protein [Prevotellaceae bacterium]